jgi:hypothetical protein
MRLSRRSFLKLAGAGTTAAVADSLEFDPNTVHQQIKKALPAIPERVFFHFIDQQ